MRHLGYAFVVVVCSFALAVAGPKKAPKGGKAAPKAQKVPGAPAPKVDPKLEAELQKLDNEYSTASMQQKHFAAVKIAKKLYDLQVKATGADSLMAERRLQTLSIAYSTANDYVNAEKHFKLYLQATEKRHGVNSQEVLYALMMSYGIYYAQQRYDDVEPIFQRMLSIQEKLHGKKSKEYAQQLSQYAGLQQARNIYTAAQRAYEEALQITEDIAPSKDDQSLVGPLQSLGYTYWSSGQQPKAIALNDRAIKIVETSKDMLFITRVATIWTIANQYSFGGRKDLSEPLFKKAIAMSLAEIARIEKATPPDPMLPTTWSMLGGMYRFSDDYAKAEDAYLKSAAAAKKLGYGSGSEAAIAEIKRIQGKYKEALALYQQTKDDLAKVAPAAATSMNPMLVMILTDMKDYARAEKLELEYIAYMTKQYGKNHPFLGSAYHMLAGVYAHAGKIKQAEAAYDRGLDLMEKELSVVLRSGTDTDHAVYFGQHGYVLDTILAFNLVYAPKSGTAARLALTTLLRRKGRILDAAAAALATIRSRLSPDDKKLLDELTSARAQLAKMTVAGAGAGDSDFAKEVAALEDKILKLEAQVSKKSAAYRTVTQPVELATIQKAIPKDARLVEIVNYEPFDPSVSYAEQIKFKHKARRYAAYIVGTSGDPTLVELGDANAIEAVIEKFRKALADPDNDQAADLGRQLYDLTMAKILPKVGGSTNLLIAPDGALNVVPFSALVDEKKQFLIAKYTFTYLTSGRDLLRVKVKPKGQGGGVMFADPKFDSTGPVKNDNKTRGARSADIKSFKWPQLPGTAAEADAVVKTFKGFKVYRGDAATEGTLKKVKSPEILHLATHGFFLPDEKPPEDESAGGGGVALPGMSGAVATTTQPQRYENPLLRSGLAFAGANKLASGDDDGLLTALEASSLDLSGTKLVVLSACETGVGKVTNGDGVYGLRRSLVIAGAESLVMSMWQVDDFATKELMSGFYKRISEGKPRSAALRETQIQLLVNPKYSHPFYWAAFVPAGATTPITD
jgi:CHAT domain-containing protein